MRPDRDQSIGTSVDAESVAPQRRGPRATGRLLTATFLIAVLGLAAACTGGGAGNSWQDNGGGGGVPTNASGLGVKITTPASDAADVPTSVEIAFEATKADSTKVELKDSAGGTVKGKMREDGSSWLPNKQLSYGASYTATVTATGEDGETATATATFTTMAEPSKQIHVSSFLGDDSVVGIAMPLIVRFDRDVPESARADVQRRMFVTSTPVQEGIWHWVSGTEVRYRPKSYWKSGTKIFYRLATGGVPMGDGYYGANDLTVSASVGDAVILTVNNKTKEMTVSKNGSVVRKIPVSLGKAKTPSSSGTMVIIEKLRKTVFDTFEELGPDEGYRADIEYAQRLTWGGEYIHAAPWSEGQQGSTNVSHGCVNVSMSNAKWLFNLTKVGDPVIIKGTEVKLTEGNGWTDWNLSWSEYVKGSAIPYEPPADDASPSPSTSADGTASPGATSSTN